MPVELQELWETAVRFCEDNVIGAIIAGTLLLLLVALILLTARGRKRRKQEADKWMAGFEERMAAFERNENPMMPPRESILKNLMENRSARDDDEIPADTTRTEAISRSAPEVEPETREDAQTMTRHARSLNLNLTIRVENVKISEGLTDGAWTCLTGSEAETEHAEDKTPREEAGREETGRETADAPAPERGEKGGHSVSVSRSGRVYSEEELRRQIH